VATMVPSDPYLGKSRVDLGLPMLVAVILVGNCLPNELVVHVQIGPFLRLDVDGGSVADTNDITGRPLESAV
jgi:hypothetical protein